MTAAQTRWWWWILARPGTVLRRCRALFSLWSCALLAVVVAAPAATADTVWFDQYGTPSHEDTLDVAVDDSGNIYTIGRSYGDLSTLGDGNFGSDDVVLSKHNASGVRQWTRQFGTVSFDRGTGVAVHDGNVYVTGLTFGNLEENFQNLGNFDAFLAKFDTDGGEVWRRQFGSAGSDKGEAVAVDSSGSVYFSGKTTGSLSGYSNAGSEDGFIAKYDANGNPIWHQQFGTSGIDYSNDIAIDGNGSVYITGGTNGDLHGNTSAGFVDAYVSKYDNDSTGTRLWTVQFGTAFSESGSGVAVDSSGNVYLTGGTYGNLENPGSSSFGNDDAFLIKYNATTGATIPVVQWTRQFGTGAVDRGLGVAVDALGNSYVTGLTEGDFDGTNAGMQDIFVTKYTTESDLVWKRQYGTTTSDLAIDVAVSSVAGLAIVTGHTDGSLGGPNAGFDDVFLIQVPEPSTYALCLLTVAGLAWARRRRSG